MRPSFSAPARAVVGALACFLICAAAATPAEAQVRLHGRVISEGTGEPLEGVRVQLMNVQGRRLATRYTDDEGAFAFFVRQAGVRLSASGLGYRETTTPRLFFDHYDYYKVEIRMDREAVLLAPLEVTARTMSRSSGFLSGFDMRRAGSIGGYFFTRNDIERRRPGYVTDLLATVPGVQLRSTGRGARRTLVMGRSAGECAALVYIDGFLMNRDSDFSIDDAVSPASIHGIEVYRGLSTVPAEYLTPTAACGAVIIWTLRNANS